MFGLGVFLIFYALFVFYAPNALGDPDNYIPANPMQTPPAIVPEWYFLPFYAILRSVPDILVHPGQARRRALPCSAPSACCSSCPGSTPRRCAAPASARSTNGSSGCW